MYRKDTGYKSERDWHKGYPKHRADNRSDYRSDYRNDYRNEHRNEHRNEYRNEHKNEYRNDYRNEHRNEYRSDYKNDHKNEYKNDYRRHHSPTSSSPPHRPGYKSHNNDGYPRKRYSNYNYRDKFKKPYDSYNRSKFSDHRKRRRDSYYSSSYNSCSDEGSSSGKVRGKHFNEENFIKSQQPVIQKLQKTYFKITDAVLNFKKSMDFDCQFHYIAGNEHLLKNTIFEENPKFIINSKFSLNHRIVKNLYENYKECEDIACLFFVLPRTDPNTDSAVETVTEKSLIFQKRLVKYCAKNKCGLVAHYSDNPHMLFRLFPYCASVQKTLKKLIASDHFVFSNYKLYKSEKQFFVGVAVSSA